jgi:hypothetical protein
MLASRVHLDVLRYLGVLAACCEAFVEADYRTSRFTEWRPAEAAR